MANPSQDAPCVRWDGRNFWVVLPLPDGNVGEGRLTAGRLYYVRIRERGSQVWSPAFITPFENATFGFLEPDTEYEIEIHWQRTDKEMEPELHVTQFMRTAKKVNLTRGDNVVNFSDHTN